MRSGGHSAIGDTLLAQATLVTRTCVPTLLRTGAPLSQGFSPSSAAMEEDGKIKRQKDGTTTIYHAILPQLKDDTRNAGKEASQRLPVGGATTSGGKQASWPTARSDLTDRGTTDTVSPGGLRGPPGFPPPPPHHTTQWSLIHRWWPAGADRYPFLYLRTKKRPPYPPGLPPPHRNALQQPHRRRIHPAGAHPRCWRIQGSPPRIRRAPPLAKDQCDTWDNQKSTISDQKSAIYNQKSTKDDQQKHHSRPEEHHPRQD